VQLPRLVVEILLGDRVVGADDLERPAVARSPGSKLEGGDGGGRVSDVGRDGAYRAWATTML
jgi:hypothetical protein